MKKLTSVLLVLIMVLAMSVSAFAGDITSIVSNNTESGVVKILFNDGAEDLIIYKVTIKWEELEFTYQDGDERVWDPDEHTYSQATAGTWSDAKKITVNNHSNAKVMSSISFDNGELQKTVDGAVVTITCDMAMGASNNVTLESALERALNNPAGTPGVTLATYTVTPSGTASAANNNFGTITVAITEVVTP